jgi:tetratricopeptide (TPR) repeat protein
MPLFPFLHDWPRTYRLLFYLFSGVGALALIFGLIGFFLGVDALLPWYQQGQTEPISLGLHSVVTGLFEFTVPVDMYLVWESFYGGSFLIQPTLMYGFSLFVLAWVGVGMALISTLPRFWYYAGVLLVSLVVVSFKLELLMVFGSPHRTGTLVVLLLFLPLSFYFQMFATHVPVGRRMVAFLGATLMAGIVLQYFSQAHHPLLSFGTHGIFLVVCVSILFILSVSHESLAALLRVLTSGSEASNRSGARHFFILSLVYLGNVGLLYFYETKVITWDFVYINPYLILLVNALLGVWGYRHREPQFGHLYSYRPVGAVVYFLLAACTFTSIGYFFITGNDPVLYVYRHLIIYAQLGYGIIFLVYLLSNFLNPMLAGKPVHRALYNPQTMPYFTFRLAGFIAVLAFVLKSNVEVPIYHTLSTYYNAVGDLHILEGDETLAQGYYERGKNFGYQNHRSNYLLAHQAENRGDKVAAAFLYSQAIAKRPTPQAYANLANLYAGENRLFEAMFTLEDGLKRFPRQPQLLTNLGWIYGKTSVVDSAYFWLEQANRHATTRLASGGNILALMAKNDLSFGADSLLNVHSKSSHQATAANYLALLTRQGGKSKEGWTAPSDSMLNGVSASYRYNLALHLSLFEPDSVIVEGAFGLAQYPGNMFFRERLSAAGALAAYKHHQVARAFSALEYLSGGASGREPHYLYILGLLAMEQGDWHMAAIHLDNAMNRGYAGADLPLALAKTEDGKHAEALALWKRLAEKGAHELAPAMVRVLGEAGKIPGTSAPDTDRYMWVKYLADLDDSLALAGQVRAIRDPNLRAATMLEVSRKHMQRQQLDQAVDWYNLLTGIEISSARLFDDINRHELSMLAEMGNWRGLAQKINQDQMEFPAVRELDKLYYTALLEQASGNTGKAEALFKNIALRNPYYEKAVLAAARLVRGNEKGSFDAYLYLQQGLTFRPRSVALLKAYIMECAFLEMDTYAQVALEDLQEVMNPAEFRSFLMQYHKARKEAEEMF